jgi:RimJ/RimL family protein N-acetyltransferase
MVFSHDTSPNDGYAFVSVYIVPEKRKRGLGLEAAVVFIEYILRLFSFRKLYFDIYEFNSASLAIATRYAKQEGYFPEHGWFYDRWWALYRFAVYRRDWDNNRLRRLLQKSLP